MKAQERSLAVIGAGPAGLFTTFYAGLRGIPALLFDSLSEPGGQIAALYSEKTIYDVGGFLDVSGRELVDRLWRQVQSAQPDVHLGETVKRLEPSGDSYRLRTAAGEYEAYGVVLAAGIGRFTPNRLGRPAVDSWEGRGLSYGVRTRESLRDLRCLVIGGGDAALDWARHLAPVARSVTLVHRRDQFRGYEASLRAVHAAGVDIRTSTEVMELTGGARVQAAVLRNNRTGEEEEVPCDAVVAALGQSADLSLLSDWGLQMEGRDVKVNHFRETNLERVYAVGDLAAYAGKLDIIATAFADGAVAVSAFKRALDPGKRFQAPHSSTHPPHRP